MRQTEDDENEILTEEELEAIFDQLPTFDQMTPQDCVITAGLLLDMDMPVPVDIIAKAHSAGLYFAH